MVVDTSALIAILQQEAEAAAYTNAIQQDRVRLLSAISAFEASIVAEARKGPAGARDLDILLHETQVEIVPFSAEQLELAKAAYRRYGKGRHPAGLNLGDCCTYALAKVSGEPLLAKGADFPRTDVRLVAC